MEAKKANDYKFDIGHLNLHYGDFHALKDVNMKIEANKITAFIGPSGCGKSTFLKTLNRMNDLVENCKIDGNVLLDGKDIFKEMDEITLRHRVGMVFQKPNPFPMSIYDNIAYGPRVHGMKDKSKLDAIVEESLRGAAIFDEVKDRLKKSALGLSGGQQQRTAIGRAIVKNPDILLCDEPTGALDYNTGKSILKLLQNMCREKGMTVIIITHNQALAPMADRLIHIKNGQVARMESNENPTSIDEIEW